MQRYWRLLLLLSLLVGSDDSVAASMPPAVDVATAPHRTSLNESMNWCRPDPAATTAAVLAGRCQWRPVSSRDVVGGAWDGVDLTRHFWSMFSVHKKGKER